MTQPIHLVVPMSGSGRRYRRAGYNVTKPLIPVNGIPMVERLLRHFPLEWPAHFILSQEDKSSELPALLSWLRPAAEIVFVPPHDKGPSFAVKAALPKIPAADPVLVSYCDYGLSWDSAAFERFVRASDCDACLISYRGFHAHYLGPTPYAYSRLDEDGRVVEVREKGNFTSDREQEYASAGAYYFKSAALLDKAIDAQMKRSLQLGGEYYTSLTVQALLSDTPSADVRVFEAAGFFQWGTPADLVHFEYWERTFDARVKSPASRGEVAQVLLPMAGRGSRLGELFSSPKPFIRLGGTRMFQRALDSLPRAEKTVLVALESARPILAKEAPVTDTVWLPDVVEGQALSVQAALDRLDPSREVLVSACDHAVITGPKWAAFHRDPGCDAAIFTVRGFPGASRRPTDFTYVRVAAGTAPFPAMVDVSVKVPISENPQRDPLLIGTFWFRTASLLREGIDALVRDGTRVKGELYLDAVFAFLKKRGASVRTLPVDGYINWGDPDSLAEALYWEEQFQGRSLGARPRFPGVTGA